MVSAPLTRPDVAMQSLGRYCYFRESRPMTEDGYYAAVRALGLRPSLTPNVYLDASGEMHNVPGPANLPPDVRLGVIRRLRDALGVSSARG